MQFRCRRSDEMSNIKELSKKYEGQILEFFKDLHMHP